MTHVPQVIFLFIRRQIELLNPSPPVSLGVNHQEWFQTSLFERFLSFSRISDGFP